MFYQKVAVMCLVVTLVWTVLIPCLIIYLPMTGLYVYKCQQLHIVKFINTIFSYFYRVKTRK